MSRLDALDIQTAAVQSLNGWGPYNALRDAIMTDEDRRAIDKAQRARIRQETAQKGSMARKSRRSKDTQQNTDSTTE